MAPITQAIYSPMLDEVLPFTSQSLKEFSSSLSLYAFNPNRKPNTTTFKDINKYYTSSFTIDLQNNTFKDYYTPINNIFVPKQTNIPEHLKYLKLPNQQISLIGVKGANPDETVEKIGAPTFGTDIDGTNYNITYFPIQDSATGTYMQTINALNSITSSITLL